VKREKKDPSPRLAEKENALGTSGVKSESGYGGFAGGGGNVTQCLRKTEEEVKNSRFGRPGHGGYEESEPVGFSDQGDRR
jgi:hypothetical protein